MASVDLASAIVKMAIGGWLVYGAVKLFWHWKGKRPASKLAPIEDKPDEDIDWPSVTAAAKAPKWAPLPGNVIELRDTGYSIKLEPSTSHSYRLFSPEGLPIARGMEGGLDALKRYGEELAAQRACFTLSGQPWKPSR